MNRTCCHKIRLGVGITFRVLVNENAETSRSGYPLYLCDSPSKLQARLKKSWRVRHPQSLNAEGFENLLEAGEVEK